MITQKRNPDALELIRGRYCVVSSLENTVKNLFGELIYGYHRDMQLAKHPLMDGFKEATELVMLKFHSARHNIIFRKWK